MKKGFAAALLILTISLNSFGSDVLTPTHHKTSSSTTTTWIDKMVQAFYNLI
jgi:hypothetical protein